MKIIVLAGGDSAEREVSLRSGDFVAAGLREAGHRVTLADPAETPVSSIDWGRFECCFPALHGGSGEDGRLQRWLEIRRIPFVGSDSAASWLGMHKSAAKRRFLQSGIHTPISTILEGINTTRALRDQIGLLHPPWIVKPDCQGSSIGVQFVCTPRELAEAVKEALNYSSRAIVEEAVRGRELTVTVLDRAPLPILEIARSAPIFDTDAKYSGTDASIRIPRDLTSIEVDTVNAAAVGAAEALGTRGLVRVDLILDARHVPWVLEVNTIPGLTATSLAPRAAAAAGLDCAGLCQRMLESIHGRFGSKPEAKVADRRAA